MDLLPHHREAPIPWGRLGLVSLRSRLLLVLLLLVALSTLVIGMLAYRHARATVQARVAAQLATVADLKQSQLTSWVTDRQADARLLADNYLNEEHFSVILDAERPAQQRAAFASYLTDNLLSIQRERAGYQEILFVDIGGQVILSTDASHVGEYLARTSDLAATLVAEGGEWISPIRRAEDTGFHEIVVGHVLRAVDLQTGASMEQPAGVVLIRIRLDQSIYPLLADWPAKGQSGEALLLQERSSGHRYLSPLRFPVPEDSTFFPTFLADNQSRADLYGVEERTDYRARPVLADRKSVV